MRTRALTLQGRTDTFFAAVNVSYKVCPECSRRYEDPSSTQCPEDGTALLSVVEERDPMLHAVLDGRYEITERIGGGGFANVYRATQHPLGRPVAVKVLSARLKTDERQLTRFAREARAICRLSSPHTVALHDFGQANDGSPYLVMELIKGRTLHQLFRQEGPLEPSRAARLAAQISESLAEAHGLGILHRDLKPDNIMVQEIAGEEVAQVLDFGLARIQGANLTVTGTGVLAGTPAYMSPEQAMGEPATFASDLYALGVILYEAVSGKNPWRQENTTATLRRHVDGAVADVATLVSDLSADFADLITSLTQIDPSQRPESARDVRQRLRQLAGESVSMPAIPVVAPEVSGARRNRSLAIGLAAAVCGALTAAVVFYAFDPPEQPPRAADVAQQAVAAPIRPSQAPAPATTPLATTAATAARATEPVPLRDALVDPARATRRGSASWAEVPQWTVALTVTGTEGAQVWLDDRVVGSVPLATHVPWSSTPGQLRVARDGRVAEQRSIDLQRDQALEIELRRRASRRGSLSDLMPVNAK